MQQKIFKILLNILWWVVVEEEDSEKFLSIFPISCSFRETYPPLPFNPPWSAPCVLLHAPICHRDYLEALKFTLNLEIPSPGWKRYSTWWGCRPPCWWMTSKLWERVTTSRLRPNMAEKKVVQILSRNLTNVLPLQGWALSSYFPSRKRWRGCLRNGRSMRKPSTYLPPNIQKPSGHFSTFPHKWTFGGSSMSMYFSC